MTIVMHAPPPIHRDDTDAGGAVGATPPPRPTPSSAPEPQPPRRRRRRRLRIALLVVLALLVPTGWSFGHTLTAPGDAPLSMRSVDWLRGHGFESVVNDVEQWWYTRTKPTGSEPAKGEVAKALTHTRSGDPTPAGATTPVSSSPNAHTAAASPLPNEGVWTPVTGLAAPSWAVEQAFVRPDRKLPALSVSLVRFDQRATEAVYVPGTTQPGNEVWKWGSEIPMSQRSKTVAAFNAGFKFQQSAGGLYTEGRNAVRPLADGIASMVIRKDGSTDIAKWGRDAKMGPDIVSVRQNLALIVDAGTPDPGLTSDRGGKWGTRKSQFQYTWRSAMGVDASGRLIYAAGSKLTLTQLADAMVDAGAVRAMQLDIHDKVVTFNWFRPAPGTALGVTAQKLTPSMERSATRYLVPDQRDFVTILAR